MYGTPTMILGTSIFYLLQGEYSSLSSDACAQVERLRTPLTDPRMRLRIGMNYWFLAGKKGYLGIIFPRFLLEGNKGTEYRGFI